MTKSFVGIKNQHIFVSTKPKQMNTQQTYPIRRSNRSAWAYINYQRIGGEIWKSGASASINVARIRVNYTDLPSDLKQFPEFKQLSK